jgi:Ca-activated chloride channel family protein
LASAPEADPVAGLVDIPLPTPVSLWPQTWPLRIAVAVIAVGVAVGVWWLARRWYRNRYRLAALAELDRIEVGSELANVPLALASLVRRTALAVFPRDKVASLTGVAWLAFLDRTADTRAFSEGAGRALEEMAYRPTQADVRPLIGAVRQWIKAHHA